MNPERIIMVVAGGAGVVAVLSGAAPTGQPVIDAVEVFCAVVLVTWFGARAPWWVVAGAAGIAVSVGLVWSAVAFAIIGFVLAGFAALTPTNDDRTVMIAAASVGLTVNGLIRSDLGGFVGWSAVVGLGVSLAVVVSALPQHPHRHVRSLAFGAVLAGGVLLLGGLALGVQAKRSESDLRAGLDQARAGMREVRDSEFASGGREFARSSESLDRVADRVGAWWLAPTRLVPILAQHQRAGATLSRAAVDALEVAAVNLESFDTSKLTPTGGAIDLDSVIALREPLAEATRAVESLQVAMDSSNSVWLVPPLERRIADLAVEIDAAQPSLDQAAALLDVAPGMLGDEETRRYLLLFVSPAESRGVGGFIGNYNVIEFDEGRIVIAEAGRRDALEMEADLAGADLSAHARLVGLYGRFGLTNHDGRVGGRSWSNLTLTPDWPDFATAAADLFVQGGHDPVDGVVMVDPHVLRQLVRYTGGVSLGPELGEVNAENLLDFVYFDQYEISASGDRVDALATLSQVVMGRVLDGGLPDPLTVARDMVPLVDERRLQVWLADEGERAAIAPSGAGVGLQDFGGQDAFNLVYNNAAANKLESMLHVDMALAHITDEETAAIEAVVNFENKAPSSGLPNYVIGNEVDLPSGWSRLYVQAFTSGLMRSATVDDEPVAIERARYGRWHVASFYLRLPPGGSAEVRYVADAVADETVPAGAPADDVLSREQPGAYR